MSKSNLMEAAADILQKSKEDAGSELFGVGKPQTKTPGQEIQDLGTAGHKTTDASYDAAKSIKKATLPTGSGVPSEPMKTLKNQPQQTMGRKDLADSPEGTETSCEDKVNGKKGYKTKETFSANPNAKSPMVPEASDPEEWEPEEEFEDELEEATLDEVLEDLESLEESEFEDKYGISKNDAIEKIEEAKSCAMEKESKVKSAVKAAKEKQESMKEDIDAMLSGENLSEDFKEKAALIFESAVNARIEIIAEELEQQFAKEFEASIETVKEDFAEKLDSYLDYVVENWMEENKLAVEKGLRSEIVEDFIEALRNVFVEHYIDIPEDKVSVVEELADKVEELESQINEEILKNIELKKIISEQHKNEILHDICEGLTLSQSEKIKILAKSVDFVSENDYKDKLVAIKESYFPKKIVSASNNSLNEALEFDEEDATKVVDPLIKAYANVISKNTKF